MKREVDTKFYVYHQNNPGGRFTVNNDVSIYVLVEAVDSDDANRRAEDIGLYFDGCANGTDCSCCGDRWYEAYEYSESHEEPRLTVLSESNGVETLPPQEAVKLVYNRWVEPGEPWCIVYYMDGKKDIILAQ